VSPKIERIAHHALDLAPFSSARKIATAGFRFNHIFDPATGGTSWRYRSVSVAADCATTADAFSTGFSLMPVEAIAALARQLRLSVYLTMPDGGEKRLNVA